MTEQRKSNGRLLGRVLNDLSEGYAPEAVSRLRGVSPEWVRQVATAQRTADQLLRRGANARVVYANFCDLLTREACGL